MVNLVLHIGQPKTGTTSLQRTFLLKRREMAARGVLYPFLHKSLDRHTALLPALVGEPFVTGDVAFPDSWPGRDVMEQSELMWADALTQIRDTMPALVVMSGEGFFSLGNADRVAQLSARLRDAFDKVSVVAYLRSPAAKYLSEVQQGLKMTGSQAALKPRAYQWTLQAFADHGPGPLHLHLFDRNTLIGQDVVTDFTTRYCPEVLDIVSAHDDRTLNTTLSAEAMAVLEHHVDLVSDLTSEERRLAWHPVRKVVEGLDQTLVGFRRPRLTPAARADIDRRTIDLNWLRKQHGMSFGDVDYSIAATRPPDGAYRPHIAELCEIDQTRRRAMMCATQDALERQKILPATLIRRVHAALTKKPR
ncbi:hypothetical protein [Aliiroseovarius subalbicans]|uniref:hypothetical protein n=1 Tax=Aliiroseovarius subalbicans TaxID=2925840 RepID=UPI001F57CDCD|nr:hypothetical protein [Aliiroseovarius subalbicans]MCI2399679.1 hypothetical protein [Aliiroseovarius subalbicans]